MVWGLGTTKGIKGDTRTLRVWGLREAGSKVRSLFWVLKVHWVSYPVHIPWALL